MRGRRIVAVAALVVGGALAPGWAGAQALIECPFGEGGGDLTSRGFYIENFPAPSLGRVLLKFGGHKAGIRVFSLTARASTYDGALIGQAFATVPLNGDSNVGQVAVFDFHGVPAPQGGIVTFAIGNVAGPADTHALFEVNGPSPVTCSGVVETEDTTPPLSTRRRDRVSLVLLAPGDEGVLRYWVAVASHATGAEGSRWRSDLIVRNRGNGTATVDVRLHRASGVVSRTLTLGPGQHLTQTDVVGWVDSGFNGSAALELFSDQPLDVTSRTYNLIAAGATCFPGATFGQSYRGMRAREGFVDGETAVLIGLAEWSDFRTNIGLTNASSSAADVVVRLYDDDDVLVYTSPVIHLTPGEWYQMYRPFREEAGRQDVHSGRAEVEVRAGTGVLVNASLVDNRTSDAATIWAVR